MEQIKSFARIGSTVSIAATGSSAPTALAVPVNGIIEIYNSGSVTAFVLFGPTGGTVASATTSRPIPPGGWAVELMQQGSAAVDAVTATGTATVYFTPGTGC